MSTEHFINLAAKYREACLADDNAKDAYADAFKALSIAFTDKNLNPSYSGFPYEKLNNEAESRLSTNIQATINEKNWKYDNKVVPEGLREPLQALKEAERVEGKTIKERETCQKETEKYLAEDAYVCFTYSRDHSIEGLRVMRRTSNASLLIPECDLTIEGLQKHITAPVFEGTPLGGDIARASGLQSEASR